MRLRRLSPLRLRALLIVVWALNSPAIAQVSFRVAIEDEGNEFKKEHADMEANLRAAAELWAERLDGEASIEIVFRISSDANAGRGSGNSATVVKVKDYGANVIYEQGMAHEIRTGFDPNGDEPDVVIVLHPEYLKTMWFDPHPKRRTAPVPSDRLDAVSVFMHELGHALAFNGWLDPATGELSGNAISTYDRHVLHDGTEFYFVGLEAIKHHGGPIPLSRKDNNYHHVGRAKDGADAHLVNDLMNGLVFDYGKRYSISDLDLAMLADTGVAVKRERSSGEPKPLSDADDLSE
jgi:hypothetical protein